MRAPPSRSVRFAAGTATLALVVTLGGCAVGPHPGVGAPTAPATPGDALEVRIPGPYTLNQGPWALFHLTQPAYVAIFDIRPGYGVTAVYPNDHHLQRRFGPGIQTVVRSGASTGFRAFYAGGWGAVGQGSCPATLHSPLVYRLVVASERPLRLERLRPYVAFGFRPALGGRFFAGGSALSTMNEILRLVLPAGAAADPAEGTVRWAADWEAYRAGASRCPVPLTLALSPIDGRADGPDHVSGTPDAPGSPETPPPAPEPERPEPPAIPETPEIERPEAVTELPVPVGAPYGDRESLLPVRSDPRTFDQLRVEAGKRAAAARRGSAPLRNAAPDRTQRSRTWGARPLPAPRLQPASRLLPVPRGTPAAERPSTRPGSPAVRPLPRSTRFQAPRATPRSSDSDSRDRDR